MSRLHSHQTPEMNECINACEDVHDACQRAVHDWLKKSGLYASVQHIGILFDCAQMAHTARDFMLRHSELHDVTCRACADICEACARKCDAAEDSALAEICRRCATLCRRPHGASA